MRSASSIFIMPLPIESDIATLLAHAGTPLAANWVEEQLHELKHQGPATVLAEVGRLLNAHPEVEELEPKVKYLQKREQLMDYPRFQQQGWPIGSGCVESANPCVVQERGVWAGHALGPSKCEPHAGFTHRGLQ